MKGKDDVNLDWISSFSEMLSVVDMNLVSSFSSGEMQLESKGG